MRKLELMCRLSQFGCISSDRNVGPWVLLRDDMGNPYRWIRSGPDGYRTLYNGEVAYVTTTDFGAYAPDGLLEETGHVWGENNKRTIVGCIEVERLKNQMDEFLIYSGWTVDGQIKPKKSDNLISKLKRWLTGAIL